MKTPRRTLLFIISTNLLIYLFACARAPTLTPSLEPLPTPTLLGTVVSRATREPPTATPRPATCVFHTSPTAEVGVYRFDWDNATITLDTKMGPVIVDGPRNLTMGERQLILTHVASPPASLDAIINFDVGGSLLYDLTSNAQEVRDAGGSVQIQNLADPANDTKGMPPYLDLVRVERTYGYYPNNVVRVYLAGIHSGPLIWSFQDVSVEVGDTTFTYRKDFNDKIQLIETDSQGRDKKWDGPVTVTDNVVAFELQVGVGDPVTATTRTSSGPVDSAGPYPVQAMKQLWESAQQFCP